MNTEYDLHEKEKQKVWINERMFCETSQKSNASDAAAAAAKKTTRM